jgi:hypothetical protein
LLDNNHTSWLIYGDKPWLSDHEIPKATCSLAQPIKQFVHSYINIPYSEENKNKTIPNDVVIHIGGQHYFQADTTTIRQMYIAVAEEAKKHDPYVWIDTLMRTTCGIVTDVRFPCEIQRLCCPSIRVYRSHVASSAMDVTETSLDDYQCDYFAVTNETEVPHLIANFPQYRHYKMVAKINI